MSEEYTVATEEELEYERALAMLKADRDAWEADCLALQAQNRDLLAALEAAVNIAPNDMLATVWGNEARAAIAKAKGGQ